MYLITEKAKLFATDVDFALAAKPGLTDEAAVMYNNHTIVFSGTAQECIDFIYSIAGRLRAVNPEAKTTVPENTAPQSFEWGVCYSIDEIIANSHKHKMLRDSGREYILAQAHDGREHRFEWIEAHKGWNNISVEWRE